MVAFSIVAFAFASNISLFLLAEIVFGEAGQLAEHIFLT